MNISKRWLAPLALSTILTAGICGATAAYPDKPVYLYVGAAPGGSIDIMARIIAPKLAERLGQSVLVENKPGAGDIVASDIVAHAAADGYTLEMVSSGHVIPLDIKMNYDLIKSFSPIIQKASQRNGHQLFYWCLTKSR